MTLGYGAYQAFGGTLINKVLDRGNADFETGLVAHWTFDGKDMKDNVADRSGNGNHGKLILGVSGNTATTTALGKIGQALEFDGTDDYVDGGDLGTGIKTAAFWVKPDSASEKIIDLNSASSGDWFNSNYTYCQQITINSSQVATTTTNGFVVVASTTQATLAATSSAGRIQKLDSNNNLPLDIIFTSGTDCNSDGGALLDFHHEKYSSTTGELVSWIEVTDISSTTDKYFLMYYGNSVATDQSNEAGTYNSLYSGVWHLAEDPSITTDGSCGGGTAEVCDATSASNDGDSNGAMTSSDKVAGRIGGAIDFDGANDFIEVANNYSLATPMMSAWFKSNEPSGEDARPLSKFASITDGWSAYLETPAGVLTQYIYNDIDDAGVYLYPTTISQGAGQWYHVSLGIDANLKNLLYIDGVLVGNTDSSTGSWDSFIGNFFMGQRGDATSFFQGVLDEVRIYNTTLHAMDILTNYNNEKNAGAFLTFGSEETETPSGGVPIHIKTINNYISANGFASPTIYVDGSASSTINAGWHHVVVTTDTGINASSTKIGLISSSYFNGSIDDIRVYNRALSLEDANRLYHLGATTKINKTLDRSNTGLEDGLVGHWTFDGKDLINNAVDSSGSGNTGYLKGFTSTTTASGKIGQALEFDGTDDYVDIPNIAIPQNFTVTAWVNSSMSANDDIIIGSGATAAGNTEAHFGYNNGNEIRYFDVDLVPDTASVSISTAEYKNTWKYITLTKEGNTTKIYSDGYLLNTTSQTGTSLKSFTYLGVTTNNPSGATQRMHGKMDDIRVYNRALSVEEINRLYHLGATTKIATTIKSSASSLETGLVGHWTLDGKNLINNVTDSSGQGNNGHLDINTATTTKAGKIGQALLLDGNAVVKIGDPADGSLDFGTNSFSYGLWVYATSSKGGFDMPMGKGGSSAGVNGYDMELGSGAWVVSLADDTQTKSGQLSAQPILNKWTHLFAVVDRNTNIFRIYVDGTPVSAGSDISTFGDVSSTRSFYLGANGVGGNLFLGLIDDIRVYNRALSAEEVARLYKMAR